jgi:hypothetical protein
MCAADPTGLPYSFGTDSLQSHLITYTDTPSNYNCLLHVYIKLSGEIFRRRICVQLTQLAYRIHSVPTVCRHT